MDKLLTVGSSMVLLLCAAAVLWNSQRELVIVGAAGVFLVTGFISQAFVLLLIVIGGDNAAV